MSHVFISYSRTDRNQAENLYLELQSQDIDTWIDIRDIPNGAEWDNEVDKAIVGARVILVVVTRASNDSTQVRGEWHRALVLNIPVIPLLFEPVQIQRTLAQFNGIKFTGRSLKAAYAQLVKTLRSLGSERLDNLQRIEAALRDYTDGGNQDRIQRALVENSRETSELVRKISEQQERVRRGLEQEQETPGGGHTTTAYQKGPRIAGPRLQDTNGYFKNRTSKMDDLGRALENATTRLVKLIGPAGIGKTALVSKVLNELESNKWPHRSDGPQVDSIIYVAADGASGLSLDQIFVKSAIALDDPSLVVLWTDPLLTIEEKCERLLHRFGDGMHILLLDGIDAIINAKRVNSATDLRSFLRLTATLNHCLSVLTTSRTDIRLGPGTLRHTRFIWLNEGLPDQDGVALLRELDRDEQFRLSSAPDQDILTIVRMVHGVPRALELFAELAANTPLDSVQQLAERYFHSDDVIATLLEENYRRLDDGAQLILLALTVYGRPVPVLAVDFLLEPAMPGLDVPDRINQLGRAQTVKIDSSSGFVALHPIDRDWLSRLQDSRPNWIPVADLTSMHRRAGDYYALQRRPKADWADISDIFPILNELEQRIKAGQFSEAHTLLGDVDSEYLERWGQYSRAIDIRERLRPNLTGNSAVVNLRRLGRLYALLGELDTALKSFNLALPLARDLHDAELEIMIQLRIAASLRDLGRTLDAMTAYRHAQNIAEQSSAPLLGIEATYGLGWSYRAAGHVSEAISYFEGALRALDNSTIEVQADTVAFENLRTNTLHNLGLCMRAAGQLDQAMQYYDQAAALADRTGNLGTRAYVLTSKAGIDRLKGDFTSALTRYQTALDIYNEIGDKWGEANALRNIGLIHTLSGDSNTAELYYDRAEPLAERVGNRVCLGINFVYRALDRMCRGEVGVALQSAQQALVLFQSVQAKRYVSHAQVLVAAAQIAEGDLESARRLASEAATSQFAPARQQALLLLGVIDLLETKDSDASRNFTAAKDESDQHTLREVRNYELAYATAHAAAGLFVLGQMIRLDVTQVFANARTISTAPGVLALLRNWLLLMGPRIATLEPMDDFIGSP